MENKITKFISTHIRNCWGGELNNSDCAGYGEQLKFYDPIVRKRYGISPIEDVLFVRDTSALNGLDSGTVITGTGFYIFSDSIFSGKSCIYYPWETLSSVEYKGTNFIFYTYPDENGQQGYYAIPQKNFIKSTDPQPALIRNLLKFFGHILELARPEDGFDCVLEEIEENEDNPQNIISIATVALDVFPEQSGYLNFEIGRNYYRMDNNTMATRYLRAADGHVSKYHQTWVDLLLGALYGSDPKRCMDSRNHRLLASKGDKSLIVGDGENGEDDNEISAPELAQKELTEFDINYFMHIEDHPHAEHKIIYTVPDLFEISSLRQNQMMVTSVDALRQANLGFDMGHPVAKQFYVSHPYCQRRMIPFENYELVFIEDRVREFCEIVASLGATEISIEAINSEDSSEESRQKNNINGKVNSVYGYAEGEVTNETSNKLMMQLSQSIGIHQKLNPTNRPCLPNESGLVWYQHEPSWQRLVKQRMSGALLEHNERIDTRRSRVVEGSAMLDLKAEIECVYADLGMRFTTDVASRFETQSNAVLSIKVVFHPIDAAGNLMGKQNTESDTTEDTNSTENKSFIKRITNIFK